MTKYRKRPIVVEAHQWFTNGDHPEDESELISSTDLGEFKSEGKIVRRYPTRLPDCHHCTNELNRHGLIDTLEGGHIVCPGDYIITGIRGERYPCKPDIFLETYELVDEVE